MKYKYVGNGTYLAGLPAKDLDDSELDPAGLQDLAIAVGIGLYVLVQEDAPAKPQKSPKAAENDKS